MSERCRSEDSQTVTVECDCGASVSFPTALRPDETLLRQPGLADTLVLLAEATLDGRCTCKETP